jgi:hypothetical protein
LLFGDDGGGGGDYWVKATIVVPIKECEYAF